MTKNELNEGGVEQGAAARFALIRRISDDLAHELKNPLNAMVINLEVLRTRVQAGNAVGALERIDVLDGETRRLHQLLDHLLRYLRPDAAGLADFPVDELLAELATIAGVLAKLGRRSFEVSPVGDDAVVRTEREPLRYALLALSEAALNGSPRDAGVALTGSASPDGVELRLAAPPESAASLRAALRFADRLLDGSAVQLAADLDGAACHVRMTVPRAY